MHVHGLVSGQIWIDMVGDVAVFAHATGEKAKLRLAKAFLRWMRTNGWSALTDTKQQSLTALFTAANKATK